MTEPEPLAEKLGGLAGTLCGKLCNLFQFEWTWRAFVVSQILGLLALVYVYFTNRYEFFVGFFDPDEWSEFSVNWISLMCIFGPLFVWKSVDWIASSANDDKQQPPE